MLRVAIVMGSDSDLPTMRTAADTLSEFGVEFEVRIISAHRTPEEAASYASAAEGAGFGVIIAAAGGAAHLAGVIAGHTCLPVVAVPILGGSTAGLDSLLSMVQMPSGIPVATVAINGARNAAILAAEILALAEPGLKAKLAGFKARMADEVRKKDARLQEVGYRNY